MARKTIKATNKIRTQLGYINFQFEYADGSKDQFKCPGDVMQNLILTLVGQPNFTIPRGDLPLQYQIIRANATGHIAIQVTYPGNKHVALALSQKSARQMGEQLIKATEPELPSNMGNE